MLHGKFRSINIWSKMHMPVLLDMASCGPRWLQKCDSGCGNDTCMIYLPLSWADSLAAQCRLHRRGNLGAAEQLRTRVWKAQADCSQISSNCPCSGWQWAPTTTSLTPREIELFTFWQFSCSRDQFHQLEGRQDDIQGPLLCQTVGVAPH